jgi:hypothetical protein
VSALLIGSAVAATLATPQIHSAPLPKPSEPPSSPVGGQPRETFVAAGAPPRPTLDDAQHIQFPPWVGPILLGALIVVLLATAGLLVFLLLRGRLAAAQVTVAAEAPVEQQRAEVLAAVDAGLAELTEDGDPRAAVIACWVRLEQAAADAGTPREPGDTPTELVLRLLAGHQVSPDVLYRLAEVYRLARYATHTVDATMRDQARAALRQLRDELSHEVLAGARR